MRRFVIVGQRAKASPAFSLVDLPGTSGRLDVLVRCLRAALLVSHGLRRDAIAYLVLLGSPSPRTVRVTAAEARFLRPDERALATLVQKALAEPISGDAFVDARPGVAVADGGLDVVIGDTRGSAHFLLDEAGPDIRREPLDGADVTFFLGDHLGLDAHSRALISQLGARPVSLGPVAVHAEDAVALASNELDRRAAR